MWLYSILLLSLFVGSQCADNGTDCLAKEKSRGILEFAKESIKKAKDLLPNCSDDFPSTNSSVCGKKEKAIAFLEIATDLITEAENNYPNCPGSESEHVILPTEQPVIVPTEKPMDCTDVLRLENNESGVYNVYPKSHLSNKTSIRVYCDMDTDGGGWTVIQKRGLGVQDFNQNWETYKKGFGDFQNEFWLGNDNIYMISNQGNYEVRFDLEDFDGIKKYAVYKSFWIDDEAAKYMIHVDNYTGTAGDSMQFQNENIFCTKDRPHGMMDQNRVFCTTLRETGWWYMNCNHVNINGIPRRERNAYDTKSMFWYTWDEYHSLAKADMKIRRI